MNTILKTLSLLIPIALTAGNVSAQATYKIGELNSYKVGNWRWTKSMLRAASTAKS
jgi:hypothetical protein